MVQSVINIVKDTAGGTRPALLYLPDDYSTGNTLYPLLFFFNGIGEAGTDLSRIYNSSSAGGPAYFIEQKLWPSSFKNPADGNLYKFIVISPQPTSGSTSATELISILKWVSAQYRVDTSRVYITGLSAGGQCVVDYITHYNAATGKTDLPIQWPAAAAVPMSAAIGQPSQGAINSIIADKTEVWGFGSMTDVYGIQTRVLVQGAFSGNGGTVTGIGSLGRFTNYIGGHCCWGQFYNPAYTEVVNGTPMNIYQWMLQFAKGASPLPPPPPPPPSKTVAFSILLVDSKKFTVYTDGSYTLA